MSPLKNNIYQSLHVLQDNKDKEKETDQSAVNFLRILVLGRWWVLEDLAVLLEDRSHHKLFQSHPVFKHPLWPQYKVRILELHATPLSQVQEV